MAGFLFSFSALTADALHHHQNVSHTYLVVTLEPVMWESEGERLKLLQTSQATAEVTVPAESCAAPPLNFQALAGLKIQPGRWYPQTQPSFQQECLYLARSRGDRFDEDHRPLANGLLLHLPSLPLNWAEVRFLHCGHEGHDPQRGSKPTDHSASLPGNFKG